MPKIAELQAVAGDRLGKDVSFLSISGEIRSLIRRPSSEVCARPRRETGLASSTGDREAVEQALGKFGQLRRGQREPFNLLIIGNDRTGLWKRCSGLRKVKISRRASVRCWRDENRPQP